MQAEELKELVADIQKLKTEKQTIEIKLANHGCPTKLFDTLSSFANQDDGGIIIFGVDENDDYKAKGVYYPQNKKKKVTKDGINPIPILAGLGLAAAAGVEAKIYLDNKKNNENEDEEDEFMDDSEFDDEFGSSASDLIADEWSEGSEIAEPQDDGLDYERPSFYSDTLGEEI